MRPTGLQMLTSSAPPKLLDRVIDGWKLKLQRFKNDERRRKYKGVSFFRGAFEICMFLPHVRIMILYISLFGNLKRNYFFLMAIVIMAAWRFRLLCGASVT